MTLTLDNTTIRKYIPNVLREVEGETPLYDKLSPYLTSAQSWLEDHFLGQEFEPEGQLMEWALKIIVTKAFADAVPSLDLVLTPNGFGIVSTTNIAPASKERVQRLIESLVSYIDANVTALIARLPAYPEWCASSVGRWWLATLLPNLDDVHRFRLDGADLLTTYRTIRSHALRFEHDAAENHIGRMLTDELRRLQLQPGPHMELINLLRSAEFSYISSHLKEPGYECPGTHEVWHLIRPVLARLRYFPELRDLWWSEMQSHYETEEFTNNIKGAFYF